MPLMMVTGVSFWSRDSQATAAPDCIQSSRHCASREVLPWPAGASSRTTAGSASSLGICRSRSRSSRFRRSFGGVILSTRAGSMPDSILPPELACMIPARGRGSILCQPGSDRAAALLDHLRPQIGLRLQALVRNRLGFVPPVQRVNARENAPGVV